MSNKTKTNAPLPTAAELDEIRRMAEENDHSGARVAACRILVRAYDEINHGGIGGNPFRALLAAFSEIAAEHDRFGCLSAGLAIGRSELWVAAMSVAKRCGLGPTVIAIHSLL